MYKKKYIYIYKCIYIYLKDFWGRLVIDQTFILPQKLLQEWNSAGTAGIWSLYLVTGTSLKCCLYFFYLLYFWFFKKLFYTVLKKSIYSI